MRNLFKTISFIAMFAMIALVGPPIAMASSGWAGSSLSEGGTPNIAIKATLTDKSNFVLTVRPIDGDVSTDNRSTSDTDTVDNANVSIAQVTRLRYEPGWRHILT